MFIPEKNEWWEQEGGADLGSYKKGFQQNLLWQVKRYSYDHCPSLFKENSPLWKCGFRFASSFRKSDSVPGPHNPSREPWLRCCKNLDLEETNWVCDFQMIFQHLDIWNGGANLRGSEGTVDHFLSYSSLYLVPVIKFIRRKENQNCLSMNQYISAISNYSHSEGIALPLSAR